MIKLTTEIIASKSNCLAPDSELIAARKETDINALAFPFAKFSFHVVHIALEV